MVPLFVETGFTIRNKLWHFDQHVIENVPDTSLHKICHARPTIKNDSSDIKKLEATVRLNVYLTPFLVAAATDWSYVFVGCLCELKVSLALFISCWKNVHVLIL